MGKQSGIEAMSFDDGARIGFEDELGEPGSELGGEELGGEVEAGRAVEGVMGIAGDEMDEAHLDSADAPAGDGGAEGSAEEALRGDLDIGALLDPTSEAWQV